MATARHYSVIDPTTGKLDRRIFSDQSVYDDEIERVFGRAWLMIGHESQVPAPRHPGAPMTKRAQNGATEMEPAA